MIKVFRNITLKDGTVLNKVEAMDPNFIEAAGLINFLTRSPNLMASDLGKVRYTISNPRSVSFSVTRLPLREFLVSNSLGKMDAFAVLIC